MENLAGEAEKGGLKFDSDAKLRLEFRGSKVTLAITTLMMIRCWS